MRTETMVSWAFMILAASCTDAPGGGGGGPGPDSEGDPEPSGCDDDDPCTVDLGDPDVECFHYEMACNDGDPCNGLESCVADAGVGECVSSPPPPCDDGDPCNGLESCDSDLGCVSEPLDCDDGDDCNGVETCDPALGCVPSPPPECADGEVCVPKVGCVVLVPPEVCPEIEIVSPTTGSALPHADSGTDVKVTVTSSGCPLGNAPEQCRIAWCIDGDDAGASTTTSLTFVDVPEGLHYFAAVLTDSSGVPIACEESSSGVYVQVVEPQVCSSPAGCSDGNPCTDDQCLEGLCSHVHVAGCCSWNIECGPFGTCDAGACSPP